MVKNKFKDITKDGSGKGFWKQSFKPRKITASTVYGI